MTAIEDPVLRWGGEARENRLLTGEGAVKVGGNHSLITGVPERAIGGSGHHGGAHNLQGEDDGNWLLGEFESSKTNTYYQDPKLKN